MVDQGGDPYPTADDEALSAAQERAHLEGAPARRFVSQADWADALAAEDERAREHMTGAGAYPAGEDDEL